MRFTNQFVLAMLPATSLALTGCGTAYTANEIDGTLLRSIVLAMAPDDADVTASQYDQNFVEGDAVDGSVLSSP